MGINSKVSNNTVKKESNGLFYQPVVFYNEQVRVGFHKEMRTIPIYSNNIFFDYPTAAKFIGIFVRQLIEKGDLPKDVIGQDGMADEKLLRTAVVELVLADLELEDDDA